MTRHSEVKLARAILTDVQFWLPAAVLIAGILLLVLVNRA